MCLETEYAQGLPVMKCELTSRNVKLLRAINVPWSITWRGFESRVRILKFTVCSNRSDFSVWIALLPSLKVFKLVSG
jgi:hypothetical protein